MLAITLYLVSYIVNDKYGQKISIYIFYCFFGLYLAILILEYTIPVPARSWSRTLKTGFADLCNEINPTD